MRLCNWINKLAGGGARCLRLGLCFVLSSSCRPTPRMPPMPVEQLVGADTQAAVWLPDLAVALHQADALLTALLARAGGATYTRLRQSLSQQIGFDPLNPDAYEQAGLRASGSLMLFAEPGLNVPIMAVPVADAEIFHKALKALFQRLNGATTETTQRLAGHSVTSLGRSWNAGTVPAAHWAHFKDYTLVAQGDGLAALTAFLERQKHTPQANLAAAAPYIQDRRALPPGLATVVLPHLTASLRWDARGTAVDARLHLPGVASSAVRALLGGPPVGPLGGLVAQDALMLGLGRGLQEPAVHALLPIAAALQTRLSLFVPGSLARHVAGLVPPELHQHWLGPVALSVHNSPVLHDQARHDAAWSPPIAGLLQSLQLVGVAQVSNASAVATLLEQQVGRLAAQQVTVRRQTTPIGDKKVVLYTLEQAEATLSWALWGSCLVMTYGPGRLEKTLHMLAAGPTPLGTPVPEAVSSLWHKQAGSLVVLRGNALAAALNATAFAGLGLPALAGGLADVLRTVDDIALGARPEPYLDDPEAPHADAIVRLELREQLH